MDIISFKRANCKNCFKCLRECPVKAIAFKNGQAEILRENCLVCGHCLTVCPQNAKQVRNDVNQVKELIASGKKVIASLAPTFIAAFACRGIAELEGMLKQLGFYAAEETSAGALLVAREYERLLRQRNNSVMISTSCPTVVKLVEKYYPELVSCLAQVVSPMTAHAKMLRKAYGEDARVIFIGPCISKKDEVGWEEEAVDYALTFDELRGWLDESGLHFPPEAVPQGETKKETEKAGFFPLSGGILKSMPERVPDIFYANVSGMKQCREVLSSISSGNLSGYFIEMSACEGSCMNGPCMDHPDGGLLESVRRVSEYAVKRAPARTETLTKEELSRTFRARPVPGEMPGEKTIREILAKTGKKVKQDELNCGACGYSTCRQKAIAVYQGKAELNMCLPYMRERAELISDRVIAFTPNAIVVLDSSLNIQALNQAAVDLFEPEDLHGIKGRYIGDLTDPTLFEEAVAGRKNILDRETFLFKNNKCAQQSVIYVREHGMVFGIFKDVTEIKRQAEAYEKVRSETADTADRVLEKQMRIAQEIAMLLGESTAETKIALTKLKDTLVSKEG